jgi:uncharacterized protein YyaL (SSP411 family)
MSFPLSNRLSAETSPYLLQHADNPVHWQPWDEQTLTLARRENRPILLSIGYSACHWCHVMAHESFEDEGVAAVMNRLFVNIKVDREERPDLDQIYQTAHQMLTRRSGGWPLTMFLSPDGTPFFGGTYFPKEPRYGLPGFAGLCERVAEAYRDRSADIAAQATEIREALADTVPAPAATAAALDAAPLAAAAALLARGFDSRYGGFGGAPKFPHPTDLAFLLRRSDADSRQMALTTLTRMSEGGIYDQIGGGFCRYSVDERWEIPHFEKMLYDNGPLLALCADAWAQSRDPLYARVAGETAAWVMREMQAPEGGYYSSLDADSEGEEGKYYVWDRAEVEHLLTPQESALARRRWGFDGPPNFENRHWHARIAGPAGRRGNPPARRRAGKTFRRPRNADPPRARRQAADQLECPDDRRHGARGTRIRQDRVAGIGASTRWTTPHHHVRNSQCGKTGACWRLPGTAAPTSTPISTITLSCSPPCSS